MPVYELARQARRQNGLRSCNCIAPVYRCAWLTCITNDASPKGTSSYSGSLEPPHVLAPLLRRQTNVQPPALWRGDSIAETHHDRVNTAPTELIHEWKVVYSLGVSRWRAFVSSRKAFAAGLGLKLLQAMYSTREGPSVIGSEVSGRVSGT